MLCGCFIFLFFLKTFPCQKKRHGNLYQDNCQYTAITYLCQTTSLCLVQEMAFFKKIAESTSGMPARKFENLGLLVVPLAFFTRLHAPLL